MPAKSGEYGFLSMLAVSRKTFLMSLCLAFLLILVGAIVAAASSLARAGIGISIGVAIIYFVKLCLATGFAIYAISSSEDNFVKAGLFIAAGILFAQT